MMTMMTMMFEVCSVLGLWLACECVLVRRVWIGKGGEGAMGIKYSWSASIFGAEAQILTMR